MKTNFWPLSQVCVGCKHAHLINEDDVPVHTFACDAEHSAGTQECDRDREEEEPEWAVRESGEAEGDELGHPGYDTTFGMK